MISSTGARGSNAAGAFLTVSLVLGAATGGWAQEGEALQRNNREEFPASGTFSPSVPLAQENQGTSPVMAANDGARYRECRDVFGCFVGSGTPVE